MRKAQLQKKPWRELNSQPFDWTETIPTSKPTLPLRPLILSQLMPLVSYAGMFKSRGAVCQQSMHSMRWEYSSVEESWPSMQGVLGSSPVFTRNI